MCSDLASRLLVAAVVVTCLSASGCANILPDDVVSPTRTHHHHRRQRLQRQQLQRQEKVTYDGVSELEVAVKPQHMVMYPSKLVRVNCTAATASERPYISFFVSLLAERCNCIYWKVSLSS